MNRKQWSWVLVDVGNSAFATTILAAVFPVYLPTLLPKDGLHFSLGPWQWTSSALSLWAYTVSASIFVTFLLSPLLGAWADEGGHKKKIFAGFTLLGVFSTLCLAFTVTWQAALLTFVFANVGFSASNVFYNSLLSTVATTDEERHRVSLNGFAWGYIGGGVLLAINLFTIMKFQFLGLSSKTQGLQLSFLSVGIWWLLFSLPAMIWVEEVANGVVSQHSGFCYRVRQIFETLRSLPRYPQLLLFMVSFAFFNEGVQTVISMATPYGKQVLNLSEETLIGTLLLVQILGLPFTLSMNWLTERLGAKRLLMGALIFWVFVVTYAMWMQSPWEFWILGILVSIVLGVSQAIPRSIFSSLVPPKKQAEFFSFFALSGKMTSILGPLVFGLVSDITHNPRLSIFSLSLFFVIGLTLFSFVKKVQSGET